MCSGSGVRCFVVRVVAEGRMFRLSNDIELAVARMEARAKSERICFAQDGKLLGGTSWEVLAPLLLPANVMGLRLQYKKLEIRERESGLALLQKKQMLEGPLWELRSPFLAPDDVVRTSAKLWNKSSKNEPYGELFFF